MEQRKAKWREGSAVPTPVDQILAGRYSELSRWGMVLTRGDAGKTEEIVQELCLYFTLTKPDLTTVVNLDGYLYTSLRHVYLSSLARSSREALHLVSIAEFDNFEAALAANPSGDTLEKQNDLRRICNYTVWRKQSSKGASYFILHFFHGYARREIAELACLPLSAIYNKLKAARSEVMSHLEAPDKLRIVNRETPPPARLLWNLLSPPELFSELRSTILHARIGDCLDEERLLAHYRGTRPAPISCSLLAHIVSCERCLSLIDRHFQRPTLKDREPLDCTDTSADLKSASANKQSSANLKVKDEMFAVRKRWGRVHEHRPRTLSIAVNGHVVAFHDVIGEHSKLSARIEQPTDADFVEVFSEQDVRFALLSIGALPPVGAPVRVHRVELSDDRWLELSLTFDGQGLQGQVAYFDPALAAVVIEEEPEELTSAVTGKAAIAAQHHPWLDGLAAGWRSMLAALTPSSAFAWAVIVTVILAGGGYLARRHQTGSALAMKILDDSVRVEAEALKGQTEHQTLRFEEVSTNGAVLEQGTVDLWKDGNGDRYLRRLYDSEHRLLAAKWHNNSGDHSSRTTQGGKKKADRNTQVVNELWDQDLSAHAFRMMAGQQLQMHTLQDGYELTTGAPVEGQPRLVSAALVLDRRLQPVRSTLHVRAGNDVHELRFVQAGYERRPSASVPDTMFDPGSYATKHEGHGRIQFPESSKAVETEPLLAELQIAVLYDLNRLGADTGEPIEVKRTTAGTIQVSGAIAGRTLKEKIVARLRSLPGHRFLDLKLFSPHELRLQPSHPARSADTRVYDIDQSASAGDAMLRTYFQSKGLSGEPLEAAVVTFSHNALQHGQRALQHAFALDRLGRALSASELQTVSVTSQQQWTQMVHEHASGLEQQLLAIHGQLAQLSPSAVEPLHADSGVGPIGNPAQFGQAANRLLLQVQELNRRVSNVFASVIAGDDQTTQNTSISEIEKAIPLQSAREINGFAAELSSSATPAAVQQRNHRDEPRDEQENPAGPR